MSNRELDIIDAMEFAVWGGVICAFVGGLFVICS